MMAVSIVLIVESIQEIATHVSNKPGDETNIFHVPAVVAVSIAFFVKFCLFCYCWGLRDYPQVPNNLCCMILIWDCRSEFFGKTIEMIYLSTDLGL